MSAAHTLIFKPGKRIVLALKKVRRSKEKDRTKDRGSKFCFACVDAVALLNGVLAVACSAILYSWIYFQLMHLPLMTNMTPALGHCAMYSALSLMMVLLSQMEKVPTILPSNVNIMLHWAFISS